MLSVTSPPSARRSSPRPVGAGCARMHAATCYGRGAVGTQPRGTRAPDRPETAAARGPAASLRRGHRDVVEVQSRAGAAGRRDGRRCPDARGPPSSPPSPRAPAGADVAAAGCAPAPVAEHRRAAAGTRARRPCSRRARRRDVAHRVDAVVEAPQPPVGEPASDPRRRDARRRAAARASRDRAVLAAIRPAVSNGDPHTDH